MSQNDSNQRVETGQNKTRPQGSAPYLQPQSNVPFSVSQRPCGYVVPQVHNIPLPMYNQIPPNVPPQFHNLTTPQAFYYPQVFENGHQGQRVIVLPPLNPMSSKRMKCVTWMFLCIVLICCLVSIFWNTYGCSTHFARISILLMEYGEAYPDISAFQSSEQLINCPPQMYAVTELGAARMPLPLTASANEYQPIGGVPMIPMAMVPIVHSSVPTCTTAIPCTTPASVLSPSPPAALSTPPLPRVFVSDHSAAPEPVDFDAANDFALDPVFKSKGAVLISGEPFASSGSGLGEAGPRRASEPVSRPPHHSFSIDDRKAADPAVDFGREDVPYLTTYQSTTPQVNHWLKRLLVFGLCALVGILVIRICMELWDAAYGENSSSF